MTDEQRVAIAREMAEFVRPPTIGEDEYTLVDYAAANGVDWQAARTDARKLVNLGLATERKVYDPRVKRIVRAYRRV